MKLSIVIAAYNEEEIISPLTEALIQTLDGMEGVAWELIYVIEGTDSTHSQAQEFAQRRPEIRILYNEHPSGLGRASQRGFASVAADADYVVTMDADFNHQPNEIPRLVMAIEKTSADIIVGSRLVEHSSVKGVPMWKWILSRIVNRAMRILMGVRANDMTSGFRVYRANSLRQIRFSNAGFAFLPEILIRAVGMNMKIVEQPISFVFREAGVSKMALTATSLSYIRLFLRYSVPSYVYVVVAILLFGRLFCMILAPHLAR